MMFLIKFLADDYDDVNYPFYKQDATYGVMSHIWRLYKPNILTMLITYHKRKGLTFYDEDIANWLFLNINGFLEGYDEHQETSIKYW